MSIQAGIETELPHLRAEEEARHVDLFRITRPDPDGRWEYNPATGSQMTCRRYEVTEYAT